VGLTLRRLTSKLANRYATEQLLDLLAPRQLGVVIHGGVEAIVHAAQAFVTSAPPLHALVKLHFRNVQKRSVCRDSIFEAVATGIHSINSYVVSAYETPSSLIYGTYTVDYTLQSSEGVQQGDPLGPFF